MSIVFDEEQKEIDRDQELYSSRTATVEAQNHVLKPVWEKVIMIVFAILCIAGVVAMQFYHSSGLFYKSPTKVYREDLKQEELNLIPVEARSKYLESFPSREGR